MRTDPCANFGTLQRLIESVKPKKTNRKLIEKLLRIPELDLPPIGEFYLSINLRKVPKFAQGSVRKFCHLLKYHSTVKTFVMNFKVA